MTNYFLMICLFFTLVLAQQEGAAPDSTNLPDATNVADSAAVQNEPVALDTLQRIELPADLLPSLFADTSAVDGAAYYSIGDVLEPLNSVYYYHPGSMGQQNMASLFSGRAGQFVLDYDGLILNDAFTGFADLNVIPTENVNSMHILHHADSFRPGVWQLGQAVQFNSLNIAALPIRSQVGYRSGYNSYNDVDVRIGIKPSVRTDLNFGATARSTNGSMTTADPYGVVEQNSSYNAYNANVKYDRQLAANWSGHYVLHYYKGNTHFPLIETDLYPNLEFPMQKKERMDQGFIFRYKKQLQFVLQKSKQQNTWHGSEHKVIDDWYTADVWRAAALANARWNMLGVQSGAQLQYSNFSKRYITERTEWQAEAFANLLFHIKGFDLQTGLSAKKFEAVNELSWQPQIRLFVQPAQYLSLLAFANRTVQRPSFLARFSTGPLIFANPALHSETGDRIAATVDYQRKNVTAFLTVSQDSRDNMLAVTAVGDSAFYDNFPQHSLLTVSGGGSVQLYPEFFVVLKGNYFHQTKFVPAHQPDYFSKMYFQYRRVFFQNDLDVTLRVGAGLVGPRLACDPWWADFSENSRTLSAQIDPYVNATIVIKSVTWFVSLENYLGASYSRLYPYTMPNQSIRFGFVWNFVD